MAPRCHPIVIALTLYDAPDRPAIDLEMESPIPSEVRHSFHNQATRRGTPLRNSADGNCARKSKNQKNLPDEIVSRFHATHYAWNWFLASPASLTIRGFGIRVFRVQSLPENDCRYPEGYHALSRQNACSAALSPRKMLRSAFRMLATDFGNRLRGRKLHLPSPQYCHIRQVRQGAVFRGSAW